MHLGHRVGGITALLLFALLAGPSTAGALPVSKEGDFTASGDDGDWRNRSFNPAVWELWDDGPVLEASPMNATQNGDPVIQMNVSYVPGHGQSRVTGNITLELFELWAPITVTNMVEHVEIDLYDGTFFHRVIDDFVTQAGDPTCKTVGVYPATSMECGSGGTGETIPMEHNENLSHVDGAIGMARDIDPDSADSQWYICETEAHNLDPENRNDEGYVTFGVVRSGMSHVSAIALTPTSDDPTGLPGIQNPASSAGRPLYEVEISEISLLGVVDNGTWFSEENGTSGMNPQGEGKAVGMALPVAFGVLVLLAGLAFAAGRASEPIELRTAWDSSPKGDSVKPIEAELLD